MLIDTHCHLSCQYYDDIDKIIDDNRKARVEKIIISACDVKDFEEAILYSEKYSDLYLSIGIHPEFASEVNDNDLYQLKKILKDVKKVVAVGEIGLDYHYSKENKEEQIDLFFKQMQIASDLNLPVVIHSRDATEDTIKVLREFPNVHGVIHCFSGSYETAMIYIEMGYKLGIGGVLTFKNSKLYRVIERIDIENIVLETDSPYLTPEPYRGRKNSSKYLMFIAKKLSEIKNIPLAELEEQIKKNTYDVFNM